MGLLWPTPRRAGTNGDGGFTRRTGKSLRGAKREGMRPLPGPGRETLHESGGFRDTDPEGDRGLLVRLVSDFDDE